MIDTKIFDKYLTLEGNESDKIKCLTNRANRFVYLEEINGEKYYIKKYIPQNRKKWRILFGIQKDYAIHYKFISDKLKSMNVPHAEPVYIKSKIIGLNKVSILVTKHAGINLEKNMESFPYEKQIDFVKRFYSFYKIMYKNGVYVTDYNFEGLLVDENDGLHLIDFDCFKTKFYLTKKYKKHLQYEIKKAVDEAFLRKNFKINSVILEEVIKIQKMIDEDM